MYILCVNDDRCVSFFVSFLLENSKFHYNLHLLIDYDENAVDNVKDCIWNLKKQMYNQSQKLLAEDEYDS